MTTGTGPLTQRLAWKALQAHHAQIKDLHLRSLFAEPGKRGERMTAEGAGLFLDYSKNRVTDETLRLLIALANDAGVAERRDAMFRGEKINITEKRAVLHVALRAAARNVRSWSTARTSCPASTPCSTAWPPSPPGCAAESGRATPASASAT